jgi:exosortase
LNSENTYESQIVLIPFITAVLIYLNRKKIFQNVRYGAIPGAILLLLGAGLWAAGATMGARLDTADHLAMTTASIVVLWLGGFLLFFGSAAFKTALFPLLFLVFFIPIPTPILERTIDFLRRGSTEMAFVILRLSGTPIHRDGFFFTLPNLTIEVAPECSGIRSGISIFISSLLAGHLFLRTFWRRGLLVLIAIPVLLFKNALRISTLSYLAVHVDQRILTSELHREGGIPFFVLGLLFLYPILLMLIKSENKSERKKGATRATLDAVPVSPIENGLS